MQGDIFHLFYMGRAMNTDNRPGTRGQSILSSAAIALAAGIGVAAHAASELPKCLYISSYHVGYAWSDGVEEGLRKVLADKCQIQQFDMDTKRLRSAEDIKKAIATSLEIIESWKPDVVITSDDNAAKHLIVPYFMDKELPFIFSGVNWTVKEYGFPASNVTGIVEVAPIEPMLKEAIKVSQGTNGIYLGAKTMTEEKNFARIETGAKRLNSRLEQVLVTDAESWKREFAKANRNADYIVMGSNSGIIGWDDDEMSTYAIENAEVVSVTNHSWMMPVTALGYTKIPQEHGEWAASSALEILAGTSPADLPIVTNRKWDLWINEEIVNSTGTELSVRFMRRAKRFAAFDE